MQIIRKATEFSDEFELIAPGITEPLVREYILEETIKFLKEEVEETVEAINEDTREKIIDGFGDVAFVAINGIYKEFRTSGDDHITAHEKTFLVMTRICNANLSKKNPDGSIIYANGKVQKPEGWQPPSYDDLI